MSITVKLSWQEAHNAGMHGFQRRLSHIFRATPDYTGIPNGTDKWAMDIEGALAEYAVCKALGVFWSGVEKARARDCGGYEVKAIKHEHHKLLVKEQDPDDAPYILVLQQDPMTFKLMGWINGKDAKQEKWRDEPQKGRPCYAVPRFNLRPIEELQ